MARQENTGKRDLSLSSWHRTLSDDCDMIDIDVCEYCHYCLSILAYIETVQCFNVNEISRVCSSKSAKITERTANRVGVPAYVVAYFGDPITRAAVRQCGTLAANSVMNEPELREFFEGIHDCEFCKNCKQGRFANA